MIAYFDSSALVKVVMDESGSDLARAAWDSATMVTTSRVANAEVRAALAAAARNGRLTLPAHEAAVVAWDRFRAGLRMVELTPEVEDASGDLAEAQNLRGFDAVHLASAQALREAGAVMVSWDDRLRAATQAVGLDLLPARRLP